MSLPTRQDLEERFHDIRTHARVWMAAMAENAAPVEKGGETGLAPVVASKDFARAVQVYRETSENPDLTASDILRSADKVLCHAKSLHQALHRLWLRALRQEGEDHADSSYYAHEMHVLSRLMQRRYDLISQALAPAGETPLAELSILKDCARAYGGDKGEVVIDFVARNDAVSLGVRLGILETPVDQDVAQRFTRLAPYLVACEIPEWNKGAGSDGRLCICPDDAPWIDAVDHVTDWLLERPVNLDRFAEMAWDEHERDVETDNRIEI